jgi:Major Facilitator Superfamily
VAASVFLRHVEIRVGSFYHRATGATAGAHLREGTMSNMVGRQSRQDRMVTVAAAAGHDLEATDDAGKWLVLAGVVVSVLLATIDGSIVNVALPTMRDGLATSFDAVQWVVLSYFLTMATATLPLSGLGDVVGRKRIYVSGLAAFTVASVLCGLAPRSRS